MSIMMPNRVRRLIRNRRRMIALCMAICFTVSYLPVAGHWLVSFKGRADLSALVVSAMKVKALVSGSSSKKEVSHSVNFVFNELKIAAGIVKVKKKPEKDSVQLTEIVPEFPIKPLSGQLILYDNFLGLIIEPDQNIYPFSPLIDPPPPRLG